MAVKSQVKFFPALLQNHQYSGMISTLLYNWPIFAGMLLFGLVAGGAGLWLPVPWRWFLLGGGIAGLGLALSILAATFFVYDWGQQREYDRLAELGDLSQANVIVDITCGKLRGTRGLLARVEQGHYFLIDIYDPAKMTDQALRRAREMEPPLETDRRIYRREAKAGSIPLPHHWADIIYCGFSLHELADPADREAIFAEFARILKPNGRLLLAEQGRDLRNFLAFGPGFFGFLSPGVWQKHITAAGLTIDHYERWRGLAHLWVAGKKPY